MIDWDTHLSQQVAHLAALCRQPAWKAWAWHQAQEMARLWPDLYREIPERVRAEVQGAKHEAAHPQD